MFTASLANARALSSAIEYVQGGYDKVGQGGINHLKLISTIAYSWIEGYRNSLFFDDDSRAKTDSYPNNNAIDYNLTVTQNQLSGHQGLYITLAWLSKGDWVYEHQNEPNPLGLRFYSKLYDPSGNLLYTSYSGNNTRILAGIPISTPGTYRFSVLPMSLPSGYTSNPLVRMAWSIRIF